MKNRALLIIAILIGAAGLGGNLRAADILITNATSLTQTQTNLYQSDNVTVSGAVGVLTLNTNSTYGTMAVYCFGSLVVTGGASIVCKAQNGSPYDTNAVGVGIAVTGNCHVAGGASVKAESEGFPSQKGPGGSVPPTAGSTHGGKGWNNTSNLYGFVTNPTCLGSGAYSAGGGGAIKLVVGGILRVDGTLQANGAAQINGGGGGGSVWITGGGVLTGTGTISASGGLTGNGVGGGGGGRISIDDTVTYSNFTGTIKADASDGGGPGTVYLPAAARSNFVVVSNQTIVLGADTEYQFGTLVVSGTVDCGAFLAGEGTGCVIRATNLTVASGGKIRADGRGWPTKTGPGGSTPPNAGATHGGKGWNNASNLYGSVTNPTASGSGSYNVAGGGAFALRVSGILQVDGALQANGTADASGGGSGGSVWISGDGVLTGTGTISAAGGLTATGVGGGGGGRVSIDDTMTYSNFTGPIKADTSDGGGPGTVYLPAAARTNFVVVSNQTIVLGAGTEYQFGTLVVSGTVDCGAFLAGAGTGCVIRATNLTVASGGKIRADGRGWPTRTGPGGSSLANAGATHGGKGWNNASNLYGSVTNPTAPGSGSYNVTGGGAFALRVSGILQLNGALQANGTADASGGGSGGSIWITGGGTLTGTGTISADGGTLYSGGGRISIDDTMTYSNFTGNLKADVTEGGGPGTIYLPAAARSNFVVVSNQTIVLGAGTEYQFGTLVVSGTVDCGAFLAGEGTGCVIHATSLTVASGGRIKADNRGWPTQRGPAPGGSGVGASHGGKGANNTNALYGNPLNPLNCGSAGIRRRRAAARSISMSAAARCGLTAS